MYKNSHKIYKNSMTKVTQVEYLMCISIEIKTIFNLKIL